MVRILTLIAASFLLPAIVFAQTQPVPSAPGSATLALPHDTHGGMTVQVDAYTDRARAKEKFGKANPVAAGILPLEVFLRNDTATAIRINLRTIRLEIHFEDGEHQNIRGLAPIEVAYKIAHPAGASAPRPSPLPNFGSGGDKKTNQMADILRPLALDSDIVPPMATIHGFFYFNLAGDMSLASNALLLIPDAVFIPSEQTLMFFEVPLGNSPSR